ncbi:MAG: hypothetical protein RLZ77_151 [Bacteroidota bacterium]|jgi:hypothetical protein
MKKIFLTIITLGLFTNCTLDNKDVDLDAINAPQNISALITIAQDNSGRVTITPRGEGVSQYEVFFGDTTTEPAEVAPGQSVLHTYASEGTFTVKIIGISLNGKRTEANQAVSISFLPPTDLVATIVKNDLTVTVTATANLETYFEVYFGDVANEIPVFFNEGETISHDYTALGTYVVKVVAKNGGTVSLEYTQNVQITSAFPISAAPTPTLSPANVISLFSNPYTGVPVDTWRTSWSAATLTDVLIAGNATKKYSSLNFVGIETVANQINVSGMTHFHVDYWTPNMTAFRIKLVDFGANGVYQGTPNDDKEHELSFVPTQSGWNSLDIPLSDFVGLTTRNHIAQLIFSGNPSGAGTVYIDNIYFHN